MNTFDSMHAELKQQRDNINTLLAAFERVTSGNAASDNQPNGSATATADNKESHQPRKRSMSPAARRKISETMKEHWASSKRRGRRKKMSATARAKISAAQKARWAATKEKQEKHKTETAAQAA